MKDTSRALREKLVLQGTLSSFQNDPGIHSRIDGFIQNFPMEKRPGVTNNAAIIDAIKSDAFSLHERMGTLSDSLVKVIQGLNPNMHFLRINHQPNTLCSLNVAGLALVASKIAKQLYLKRGKEIPVVFICMDYDLGENQRFRSPVLPCWSTWRQINLVGAVGKDYRDRLAFNCPPLSPIALRRWRETLLAAVKHWKPFFGKSSGNACELGLHCYEQHGSLTAQNIHHISFLVNSILELPIVFVRGSRLLHSHFTALQNMNYCFKQSISEENDLQKSLWRICRSCHRRNTSALSDLLISSSFSQVCMYCGDFFPEDGIRCGDNHFPSLTPKVTLDDFMEHLNLPLSFGVHYAGGIEHVLASRIVSSRLGLSPAPDFLWDPYKLIENSGNRQFSSDDLGIDTAATDPSFIMSLFNRGRFPTVFYHAVFGQQLTAAFVDRSLETESV